LKEEITMLQIGKMNTLTVVELEERGAWLAADEYGELLLPRRQLPEGVAEEARCPSSSIWMRIASR
jgi:predicted RNA-binding protein (virulence factor B family)